MILARGIARPKELFEEVNALAPYPSGVVNLRYTVDNDWSGDPAIFFWITLSDEAARPEVLSQTSRRVRDFITQRLDPMGQWDLIPYFNFRSQSEQAGLKEQVFGYWMAYHDDLIQQAIFLSELNLPNEPKQVDLRRAVSAAYYALFHLLTTEAAQNWKHESQRNRFARMFDHGRMKACSSKVSSRPLPLDPNRNPSAQALKVAPDSFVTLQQARHTADYDNSGVWSRAEVWEMILPAENAILAWSDIREKESAQDYLLDLMGTR